MIYRRQRRAAANNLPSLTIIEIARARVLEDNQVAIYFAVIVIGALTGWLFADAT